jgi:hypothetical protein
VSEFIPFPESFGENKFGPPDCRGGLRLHLSKDAFGVWYSCMGTVWVCEVKGGLVCLNSLSFSHISHRLVQINLVTTESHGF